MITPVLHCPYCHSTDIVRHGTTSEGKQRYRCRVRLPQVTDHVQTNFWLVETICGTHTHLEGHQLCVGGSGCAVSP